MNNVRLLIRRLLPLGVLWLAGIGVAPADQRPVVHLGVLHHRGVAVAEKAWAPMIDYLNARVADYRFDLVPLDYAGLHAAVASRRVDFTFTAAGQYVELEIMHGATRIATVQNTGPNGDVAEYGGVFVVRAGAGPQEAIRELPDLRRRTLLIPDESSFGGWLMQRRELAAIGLKPQRDFSLIVSGDNEQTFFDLLAGRGDVAAARSGVLERMVAEGKVRQEDFRLIRSRRAPTAYPYWVSTPLYPEWPLARMRHTPDQVAKIMLVALLELPRDSAAARAAGVAGFTVPKDYQPVHALYRDLELWPYAHKHLDWRDLVDHYGVAIVIGALLIALAVAALLLRLKLANRRLIGENSERHRAEAAERAERERAESYLELMGSIFVVLDRTGRVILANRRANEVLGYADGELEGQDWFAIALPEGVREEVRRLFDAIMAGERGDFSVHEHDVLTRDGRLRHIRWNNRFIRDAEGRAVSSISAGDDITEQRQSEAQAKLFAQVFEASAEGVMICDAERRIVSINRAFTEITGFSLEEVRGKNPKVLSSGNQTPDFYRQMWAELEVSGLWQGEIWNRRKSGEVYPEWLSVRALTSAHGDVTHYVGIFTDISRHKEDQERIHFLAYYDSLTRLPNRALLSSRFEQAVALAIRNNRRLAILFVDLDRFKQVNDSLGHQVGDILLQGVAERFGTCVRESDTLARLGGDEFILLLPDIDTPEDAAAVAQKCIQILKTPFVIEGHEMQVSPSIGIAVSPQDGVSLDTLVKNADAAMYAAKDAGRATWRFFTGDMNARIFARMLLENQLRRAIERREFVLHYQPQLSIATGRVIGVEALVRWQHPEQGLVYPGDFIAVAEDCGLIAEIGRLVLREATSQMAAWHAAGLPKITVAVNVSAPQFRTENFFATVTAALAESGLPPACLELELTESILVQDVEETLQLLDEFKRLGVMLSVDDFGTGYSSLSYLKRFPVDRLKVDQSFVRGLIDDHDDRAIVASVIAMGKNLRLHVLAEGVETAEHLAILKQEGCEEYQGYLFSKPLPAAALATLLAKDVVSA